ncbi:MAG: NlpC/P60 family protein [Lachnospiraceae bacterium]|nr:NlpC/P60 family protein [Lachnospiraceae bacterium]
MKKAAIKITNLIIVIVLVLSTALQAEATTVQDIQNNINKDKDALAGINDTILDLQDEQDLLEEEISDLDAELLNTMTAIGLLEDDIAAKEADILVTQAQHEEAKRIEEEQYEAMVARIQLMYESGGLNYMAMLFESESFGEILNQASYIEALYDYDREMLDEYETAKEQVKLLWDQLEAEKASLEADKVSMEDQKVYLDGLLLKKQEESANFEAQIARARQEASALKVKIKQEQAELKKLQDEEQRKNAANGKYTVSASVSDIINGASGSDLAKQIARYGCQFIGNPYVLGGTSLTKGADCSGFTYRIYSDFGYSIPRTSYQQRSAGTEVAYADAQPGDLICYDGHVALYIGGGYIVHASSAKTGIKLSKATYRKILSVRRII